MLINKTIQTLLGCFEIIEKFNRSFSDFHTKNVLALEPGLTPNRQVGEATKI